MRLHVSLAEFKTLLTRPLVRNAEKYVGMVGEKAEKRHKYGAKRVTVDGHTFPSLLEAKWYTTLKWQAMGGLITEPLLQVRFSLGEHYGRERVYIADFTALDLKNGQLLVMDAKGVRTDEYKRKKATFEQLYGLPIRELGRMKR